MGARASATIGDLKCACRQRCIQSGDKFPELLRCMAAGPEQAAVLPDTETVERQPESFGAYLAGRASKFRKTFELQVAEEGWRRRLLGRLSPR